MKQVGALARLVLWAGCLASVIESMATPSGDPCDFSGLDMEDMVNTIVRRLPSRYTPPALHELEFTSGIFGRPIYHNMDKLETFSPVVGFCRDGLKLIQVDLVNTVGLLHMVTPWRTCGGKNGTIDVDIRARVTVTFEVADPMVITNPTLNESPVTLHGVPQPVFVETESVRVKGAGEVFDTVASVLGRLVPGIFEEKAEELVTYRLRDVLNEIVRT
ncbi:uncharacterized protein LOC144166382 [Haemaphysalis longicornis]